MEPTAGVPEIEGATIAAGTEGIGGEVTGAGVGDGVGDGAVTDGGDGVVLTGGAVLFVVFEAGCLVLLRLAPLDTRTVVWRITDALHARAACLRVWLAAQRAGRA